MDEIYFGRTPKHERLRDVLRAAIKSSHFRPGDKLGTEEDLCLKYGVSRSTVREAIGSLVHEGLLSRTQGKGTYVSDYKKDNVMIASVLSHLHRGGGIEFSMGYDIAPQLLHFIEDEAKKSNASVLLSLDNDDVEVERENLCRLLDLKVDGAVVYYIGSKKNIDCLERIQTAGIPLVLIDRYPEGFEADYVVTDNFAGAYNAVNGLLNNGFNEIFHITVQAECSAISDRMAGYRTAVERHGLPFDEKLVKPTSSDDITTVQEESYHIAGELLQKVKLPFAIFAANAAMLVGIWRAIEEKRLPHDSFALACFDEPDVSIPDDILFLNVIQPLEEMGRQSIRIVMDRLSGDRSSQRIVLEPEIHTRGGAKFIADGKSMAEV